MKKLVKILALLIVLVLAMLAAGCAPAEPTYSYMGEVGGVTVSFDYPEGWEILDETPGILTVMKDESTGVIIITGDPTDVTMPELAETPDSMLYSLFNLYASVYTGLEEVSDRENVIIGGVDGLAVNFEGIEYIDADGNPVMKHLYVATGSDDTLVYLIEASATGDGWDAEKDAMLNILDSLEFS